MASHLRKIYYKTEDWSIENKKFLHSSVNFLFHIMKFSVECIEMFRGVYGNGPWTAIPQFVACQSTVCGASFHETCRIWTVNVPTFMEQIPSI